MTDSKMSGEPVPYSKRLIIAAAAPFLVGAVTAGGPAALDWQTAIDGFPEGEQRSPMAFTKKEAARCSGRWMLHADAVDDGAFPKSATDAFIEQLRLPSALNAADFFVTKDRDHPAYRDAADEAERLLALAIAGDAAAAGTYFDNLGLCSTRPETLGDAPAAATDAIHTVPVKLAFSTRNSNIE